MKTIMLGLTLLGFVNPVLAVDRTDLDARLLNLTAKFEALEQKPDRCVPAEDLSKARGLVLLDRTKGGFGFAYQGGGGVLLVKRAGGQWSPPVFLKANEASFGFQVGGEDNFQVVVLLNTNSIHEFASPTSELGGAARGTAGNDAAGVGGQVSTPKQFDTLVFSDRTGLYGGAFVKNGVISPDAKADLVYYGQPLSVQSILYDASVRATPAATVLAEAISRYAK